VAGRAGGWASLELRSGGERKVCCGREEGEEGEGDRIVCGVGGWVKKKN
jgi:hypothetical protein